MKRLKVAKYGYIIMSVIFYALAVMYMMFYKLPAEELCIIASAVMMAYGIIKIIGFFSKDLYCLAFEYDLAFGIMLTVMAVLLFFYRETAKEYLEFVVGIVILADSLFKVQMSFEAKKFGLETWKMIFILSVITCIFSILLIIRFMGSLSAVYIISPIVLFLEGAMNHCVVICTVKNLKVR